MISIGGIIKFIQIRRLIEIIEKTKNKNPMDLLFYIKIKCFFSFYFALQNKTQKA
jgi:hypothetical protein